MIYRPILRPRYRLNRLQLGRRLRHIQIEDVMEEREQPAQRKQAINFPGDPGDRGWVVKHIVHAIVELLCVIFHREIPEERYDERVRDPR